MDLGEFVLTIIIISFVSLLFFGLYNILTQPVVKNYVYECRYSCQQLKNTANNKCDVFDLQLCFNNCLELMVE